MYFLVKKEIAHITKYQSLMENILEKFNYFKTWRKAKSDRANYSCKDTASALLVLRDKLKKMKIRKLSVLENESMY